MNTFARRALLLAALASASGFVQAQQAPQPAGTQPLPELAPGMPQGADEPVITIRRQEGSEFKEYRVRGQLQAVKVTPAVGKPYWLINRNGEMQRHDGPSPNLTVPSWLVLEW